MFLTTDGAVNTFRQLGYALGVAIFGTLVTSRMEHSLQGAVTDPHGAARAPEEESRLIGRPPSDRGRGGDCRPAG